MRARWACIICAARAPRRDSGRGRRAPRVGALQQIGAQQIGHRPGQRRGVRHEKDSRGAVLAHQRQVVHGGHDGDAALHQAAQQGHHFDLASQVQVLRRLIEQHELRLLRQRNGDLHPLTFAAGEFGKNAMAHAEDIDGLHGALHRVQIAAAETAEETEMRNPSLRDDFLHAEGEGHIEMLRHQRHAAGELTPRPLLQFAAPAPGPRPPRDARARRPA